MNPSPVRLSLSMIVRNEEEFLAGCLASVRGIVDEIVIVDTGSTDRTMLIARQAGATVIEAPWEGDFSLARNRSLDACHGEWVLYLDADERLAGGQEKEIAACLEKPGADAYHLLVRSTLRREDGRQTIQVMPYPRLFRNAKGVRFERPVHEQIAPSILRNGGKVAATNIVIEHLGYDKGFDVLRRKIQRNLDALLRMAEHDPEDWYARLQLARSSMLLQDYDAVVRRAREALKVPGIPRPSTCALHNLLAEAALRTRDAGLAVQHCERSLALHPEQIGARWFLAGALMTQGNPGPAITVLESLLQRVASTESSTQIDDLVIPVDAVEDALGRCYSAIGNWERAAEILASALKHNPSLTGAWDHLFGALEKLDQPAVSLRCARAAAEATGADTRLLCYLAMAEHNAGNHEQSIAVLDRVLRGRPSDPVAWSWKALWSLKRKDFTGAAAAVREAQKKGVHTAEMDRCEFELALHEGNFSQALALLDGLERLYAPEDFAALKSKISQLARIGSPVS